MTKELKKRKAFQRTSNRQTDSGYSERLTPEISSKIPVVHIQPMNDKQDQLLISLRTQLLTVAVGSVGTGKTYLSVNAALNLWGAGKVSKLVLTRANVPTGRSLGFFPGTIQEKLSPWLGPMISVLKSRLGAAAYDYHVKRGAIVLQPLETIRGASFDNTVLLVDEAQNLTMEELKALSTRLGQGSRLVLMGDPNQSDLRGTSDLNRFCAMLAKHSIDASVVRFTVDDIVRSDIVGQLARAFEKEGL